MSSWFRKLKIGLYIMDPVRLLRKICVTNVRLVAFINFVDIVKAVGVGLFIMEVS